MPIYTVTGIEKPMDYQTQAGIREIAADYWKKHLKTMYKELKSQDKLEEKLDEAAEQTFQAYQAELKRIEETDEMQGPLAKSLAWDRVREMWIMLPSWKKQKTQKD